MSEVEPLFFALRPPPPVRTALAAATADPRHRARRVHPDDLHLTLAFLGAVAEPEAARRAGARAVSGIAPFRLTLDRFGLWRRRGIAWAAPACVPDALQALHAALGLALAREGWPVEQRPFRPHVTLARHARRAPRAVAVAPWYVATLLLLESGPPPAPRYRTLASWELDDRAGGGG